MFKRFSANLSMIAIAFTLILSSCAPKSVATPAVVVKPAVTETFPTPGLQPNPSSVPTTTPEASSTPSTALFDTSFALPTVAPVQWPTRPIALDSAKDIQELYRWGRGTVQSIRQLERNSEQFLVQTPLGVYLYQEAAPYVLAFIPDTLGFTLSEDERLLAVSLKNGDVQIRNMDDMSLIETYVHSFPDDIVKKIEEDKILPFYVGGMTFSPDGAEIAVGYADGKVELRRIGETSPYLTLKHDSFSLWKTDIGLVFQISYSPDGKTLVVFKFEPYINANRITFWSLPEGKLISLSDAGRYYDFAQPAYLSDDQTLLVLSREDSYLFLTLWDIRTGERIGRFGTDLVKIYQTGITPDGNEITILGSDSEKNSYRIVRELPGGKLVDKEKLDETSNDEDLTRIKNFLFEQGHYSNAWGEDDDLKLAQVGAFGDQSFRVLGETHWLTFPEGNAESLNLPENVTGHYFDFDDQSITWCQKGAIFFQSKNGSLDKLEVPEIRNCDGMTVSPNKKYATAWYDITLYLIDLESLKVSKFSTKWESFFSSAFTSDEKTMIGGSYGNPYIFQVEPFYKNVEGELVGVANMREIVVSRDKEFMVTLRASENNGPESQILIWRLSDAFVLRRINPPFIDKVQPKFTSFALSPDDRLIASGDNFGGVRIWSVETGDELAFLEYDFQPLKMTFNSDGSGLIIIFGDGTIRLLGIP
jgi:WD40 repeat protein